MLNVSQRVVVEVTIAVALLALLSTHSLAATGDFLHRFLNPNPDHGDAFGGAVAATKDYFAVGARYDDAGADDAGAAYVFSASTMQPVRTFNNPTPRREDQFGAALSVNASRVLIGAPGYDDPNANSAGAAYLFDIVTGGLTQTFLNPSPQLNDQFGKSVAISGDRVLVGAIEDGTAGVRAGAAYVFSAITGQAESPVLLPITGGGQEFGFSVAWIGNDIAVGAPGLGTVYLFDGSTKALKNMFFTQTGDINDRFGESISNAGGHLLVGAPRVDVGNAEDVGAAYLFDVNTGALLQEFENPSPHAGDMFGTSAAATYSQVLIGAYGDDTLFANTGAAYVMDIATGDLIRSLVPISPLPGDFFGISVAAADAFLVGGSKVGPSAIDFGAAFVFQGPEVNADFDNDGVVDGTDFLIWQRNVAATTGATLADGDANDDEEVNGDDLAIWKGQFDTSVATATPTAQPIPEPAAMLLALLAIIARAGSLSLAHCARLPSSIRP